MVKTVLITGCSSGIGKATAEAFLAEGWSVYATARNTADITELKERGCQTTALDVTDRGAVDAVVDRILEDEGAIDCLVNNAGVVTISSVEETSPEAFHDVFDVNLFGPHRLIRAVVPHMRRRERGRIINVGSVADWFPVPLEGAYCASKFGLRALSSSLRDELRPFGVDVILVEPPFVKTRQARQESRAAAGRSDSPYASLYERFERVAQNEYDTAPGPEAVGEKIVAAATTSRPRPRYPVGRTAWLQTLAGLLPPTLRYRLWSRAAKR